MKTITKIKALSRDQLKNIKGGVLDATQNCIIYTINGNVRTSVNIIMGVSGSSGLQQVQAEAANVAQHTGQRVGYDCGSDGFQHNYA